jgi:hypothetical protein
MRLYIMSAFLSVIARSETMKQSVEKSEIATPPKRRRLAMTE